jgi:hypothetical protein
VSAREFGLGLALLGGALVVLGVLVWAGALTWFGRLPGDIRIERDGLRIYVPIVSMLLVSLVLSLLFRVIKGR